MVVTTINAAIGNPMKFTLGQAALEVGRNKSTLSRDIAKGRLSAEKMPDGSYTIDASELFRVYEKRNSSNSNFMVANASGDTGVATENIVLRTQLDSALQRNADKDNMLRDKDKQLEDVQQERDHWRKQATYLLDDKSKKEVILGEQHEIQRSLSEQIAREQFEKGQLQKNLDDAKEKLDKVRRSWIGRLLYTV